ncbi:MAG: response regulator, partial [Acidobacteriota bacterium]|nr:response regulator [Acidobacteriota bacterium]
MKVLIVDDERRARERMARLLGALPDIEVIGEAADGLAALESIATLHPDAVFLDVQMPGLSGFEVISQLPAARRPSIVFVTAYDQFALQAFEVSAVDYLMKPVEEERLARAVAKLQNAGSPHELDRLDHLDRLVAALEKGHSIQRVVGKKLRQLHVLAIETVEAFVADEELVFAITADGRFLVEKTLRELEAALDPERFARVHKQAIVNLGKIAVLEPIVKGGATARLQSGEIIAISRRYT